MGNKIILYIYVYVCYNVFSYIKEITETEIPFTYMQHDTELKWKPIRAQ